MADFSEYLPQNNRRKAIGKIINAYYDATSASVKFTIEFFGSGHRLNGAIPSGNDPKSANYLSPRELERKVSAIKNLTVYDNFGGLDPDKMTPEQIRNLRINLSLKDLKISVADKGTQPDSNSFLSRMFR